MTLFNISFTAISTSGTSQHSYKGYKYFSGKQGHGQGQGQGKERERGQGEEEKKQFVVPTAEKSYVIDPYVEDILIYSDKKTIFELSQQSNRNAVATNIILNSFNYKRKHNFLNSTVCQSLNDLKKWVNNQNTLSAKDKHGKDQMEIVKTNLAANKINNKKNKFENSYVPNFNISLSDFIIIAYQESLEKCYETYFQDLEKEKKTKGNVSSVEEKTNLKKEQAVLKTKILYKNKSVNTTIDELLNEEKKYMSMNIKSDKQVYYSGKYVKTKGYYKNVEERCNAVFQPLNFSVYI